MFDGSDGGASGDVVGIVMVIALITLPAAWRAFHQYPGPDDAGRDPLQHRLYVLGVAVSYGANLPAGATIIVLAGLTYLIVAVPSHFIRRRRAP